MTEQLMYKQAIKKAYKIKQKIQQEEQNLVVVQKRLAENKEIKRLEIKKLNDKLMISQDRDRVATLNHTITTLTKTMMDEIEL